jgi:hypothetical protein
MSDDQQGNDDATLSVQLANQIINVANSRLEDGMPPDLIAAGLRHAAANFSAFIYHRSGGGGDEALSAVVEDFLQGFEYYLDRHAPQQTEPAESAAGGLKNLIEQAKREV